MIGEQTLTGNRDRGAAFLPACAALGLLFFLPPDAAVAAKRKKEDSSFAVPRAEILAKVRRVGILPVNFREPSEARPGVREFIEQGIAERLTAAGFVVVGSATYATEYSSRLRELGGVYDPRSGRIVADKARALEDYATRRFIEAGQLDGVLTPTIRTEQARFVTNGCNWKAAWDGIEEDYWQAPESAESAIPSRPALVWWKPQPLRWQEGSTTALSLDVRLDDANRGLLYRRAGGIQPLAYPWTGCGKEPSVNGFARVPPEALLRDNGRLDRAIGLAMDVLVLSPEQRTAAARKAGKSATTSVATLPLPPAQSIDPAAGLSPTEVLARVRTVAVVPEVFRVRDVYPLDEAQLGLIGNELAAIGIAVVDNPSLRAFAAESAAAGFYDPFTGVFDEAKASAARRALAARIATGTPPVDAIVWATMVPANAPHKGGHARWDGAEEFAVVSRTDKPGRFSGMQPAIVIGSGFLRAASVEIVARDLSDALLFRSLGGVTLLERVTPDYKTGEIHLTAKQATEITGEVPRGIRLALQPLSEAARDRDPASPQATERPANEAMR